MRAGLICVDVDGTLTTGVGGRALPGAADALAALRRQAPVLLVTNTTSRAHRLLADHLTSEGVLDEPARLVTPAAVARRVLPRRGHDAGLLLVEPGAREDYTWFREAASGPAVLIGTEAHDRTLEDLQPAFRAVLEGAALYTLQRNRYFRRGEELVTDLGPVAAFLGYAAGREAETLGKPSRLLFEALASEAGVPLERVVMVGDDAEFDASGAVALGMRGVLVRTGKYRPGAEAGPEPPPTAVLDSIRDLPRWLAGPT
ncbi:MAG: HAD hydrolase-like protein [Acidobacteriota bacterium]|jgi:HAD superfamily hydrolase (TIGR01458 family)